MFSCDGDNGKNEDEDADPPANFLPKGWVLFKSRGPMLEPMKYRLDLFSTSLLLDSGKGGRKAFWKSLAEEKNKSRDHEFDNVSSSDVDGRDAHGVGSANRKFMVDAAQCHEFGKTGASKWFFLCLWNFSR